MNGCGLVSAICIRRIWFFIFFHHLQDYALKTCFFLFFLFSRIAVYSDSELHDFGHDDKNLYSLLFVVEPQVTIRTFGNSGNILSNVPQGTGVRSLSASFRIGVNDGIFSSGQFSVPQCVIEQRTCSTVRRSARLHTCGPPFYGRPPRLLFSCFRNCGRPVEICSATPDRFEWLAMRIR